MAATRVALVTGASRGLGAQISRRLAAAGWAVAVNYRADRAAAVGVVEAIREAGGEAEAVGADVIDERAVTALVGEVERRLGPVVG
ncbi:MAG: SDR family NAD(P)-dependent oxidoreductase, partial [Actinomycetota bacterium]|nr:SDR family NAD(P)-dependent oxidoreductase [Actinomycetota bacterium]